MGQKIMQPLGTKKNHTTSQDKITTQPLGQQNHATSRDKKIKLSIGPIASKLVYKKAPNCSKWHQICPNLSKHVRIDQNGSKLVQTFPKGPKWVQMGKFGLNRSKWDS